MLKNNKNTLGSKCRPRCGEIGILDLFGHLPGAGAVARFKAVLRVLDRATITGPALGLLIAGISIAVFDPTIALVSCLLGWTMLAIAITDARRFIIPDLLSLPAIPAGIVISGLTSVRANPDTVVMEHVLASVIGAAGFYAIACGFRRLRGRDGLGLGDVKLAAVAGAWTGMEGASLAVLGASIGALSVVAFTHFVLVRQITRTTMIPFGVFFAPTIWLVWSLQNVMGS